MNSYCNYSFVSQTNGYRYCGDPVVYEARGYQPYCPDNPGSAFKCPRGCRSKNVKPIQTKLEMF
jgi:hypothetical protein